MSKQHKMVSYCVADALSEGMSEIEAFCDELDNAVDGFEGAEFPGMYR